MMTLSGKVYKNKGIFICQQHFRTDQYHVHNKCKTLTPVKIPELNIAVNLNQDFQLKVSLLKNKLVVKKSPCAHHRWIKLGTKFAIPTDSFLSFPIGFFRDSSKTSELKSKHIFCHPVNLSRIAKIAIMNINH